MLPTSAPSTVPPDTTSEPTVLNIEQPYPLRVTVEVPEITPTVAGLVPSEWAAFKKQSSSTT